MIGWRPTKSPSSWRVSFAYSFVDLNIVRDIQASSILSQRATAIFIHYLQWMRWRWCFCLRSETISTSSDDRLPPLERWKRQRSAYRSPYLQKTSFKQTERKPGAYNVGWLSKPVRSKPKLSCGITSAGWVPWMGLIWNIPAFYPILTSWQTAEWFAMGPVYRVSTPRESLVTERGQGTSSGPQNSMQMM